MRNQTYAIRLGARDRSCLLSHVQKTYLRYAPQNSSDLDSVESYGLNLCGFVISLWCVFAFSSYLNWACDLSCFCLWICRCFFVNLCVDFPVIFYVIFYVNLYLIFCVDCCVNVLVDFCMNLCVDFCVRSRNIGVNFL